MKTTLIAVLLSTASLLLPCAHAQQSDADGKELAELRAKAENGDAKAQNELGEAFRLGKFGAATNYVEAVKWWRKAAGQNHAEAQYNLGVCYTTGQGMAKDEVEAVNWYCKAAEQNYAEAQYNLGVCYATDQGVIKDEVEAYKWWLLASAQGKALAKKNMTMLERKLTREQIAEGQKRAANFKLPEVPSLDARQGAVGGKPSADLLAHAEQGEVKAQNELRGAFHDGKQGVVTNSVEAVKWFRYPPSQSERTGDAAKHEVEAFKWFLLDLRAQAEKGDAKAQTELGEVLRLGKLGGATNQVEAVKWFRKAAKQGSAIAHAHLGIMYQRGEGVPRDLAEALKWHRKAAELGWVSAQLELAKMFADGEGVPQDLAEALKWYRMAADQGDAGAQRDLGVRFAEGNGVPTNNVNAYLWFDLASRHLQDAANRRDKLESQMSSEQIAEARRLSAQFVPRKVPPEKDPPW